jgi:hypothetical protein
VSLPTLSLAKPTLLKDSRDTYRRVSLHRVSHNKDSDNRVSASLVTLPALLLVLQVSQVVLDSHRVQATDWDPLEVPTMDHWLRSSRN